MKKLLILFVLLIYSNFCGAVLTPYQQQQVNFILDHPYHAMMKLVGLYPCSNFGDLMFSQEAQGLDYVEELCSLFNSLLKEIKRCPRTPEEFKNQSTENKKLYKVLSSVFCYLVLQRVILSEFDQIKVEEQRKAALLKKLNHIFEESTDLIPFLKIFPLVLFNLRVMSALPILSQNLDDIDKAEPFFCHLMSKTTLLIIFNPVLSGIFSKRLDPRELLEKLKTLYGQTLELFIFSCENIFCITRTALLEHQAKPLTFIAPSEPPNLEQLWPSPSIPKKRNKKRKSRRGANFARGAQNTYEETFNESIVNDCPQEEVPLEEAQNPPSIPTTSRRWDGPLLDLEPSQDGLFLMRGRDCDKRMAIFKRSHSAPPVAKSTRESF